MQLIHAFARDLPGRVQQFDYDTRTDGQPVYYGHAPLATADATADWVLFKYTFNTDGFVTKIQTRDLASWSIRDEYFT